MMSSQSTTRPRILCISFSDISSDARVKRQIDQLKSFGEITTLGYGVKPEGVSEHKEIPENLASLPQTPLGVLLLAFRLHRAVEFSAPAVRSAVKLLPEGETYDLIVANEARALPLAHQIAQRNQAPVWGDMHEWAPEERTHVLSWRLLVAPYMTYLCRTYLPITQGVSTVNASIKELYESTFGLHNVEIVRNAIDFQDLHPSEMTSDTIRLVHSGAAVPGRNIESLIRAVQASDPKFTLDFYLIEARDGGRYLNSLKEIAAGNSRISFNEKVDSSELPATLNKYDVGVYSIPAKTTNHRLMLPNKFFDFVQARLAIIFSPSVETDRLITEHDLGIITRDASEASLIETLQNLTQKNVQRFKHNSDKAAHILSAEQDNKAVQRIISGLLDG